VLFKHDERQAKGISYYEFDTPTQCSLSERSKRLNQPQIFGFLQGISPNVQNERYSLVSAEVLIGRGSACQIQLKDPKVSRQHARIRFDRGVITIEDLKSSQGTLVNGQQMLKAELKEGDELTLGDTRLRFEPLPDAVATMMVDDPVKIATVTCRNCGEKVPTNVRFCARCGQPLHPRPTPTPAPQPIAPVSATPSPTPQPAPPPVAPVGTDKESGRRWLPFLLGAGIPVVLGIVGVLALVVLGVFDEPEEPPAIAQTQPSIIEPTVEEESIEPPYTFRPFNIETDGNLPAQSDLAVYDEQAGDSEYLYEIPLVVGQEVILDFFYCGTSEAILEDISRSIDLTFEIDGVLVLDENLYTEKLLRDTRACYISRGVFQRGIPGENVLVQTMRVTEQINDGWETWGPETLESRILIRVEGDAVVPPDPIKTIVETAQPDEPTVEPSQSGEPAVILHVGDARMFSTPPEIIAYANSQASPAPPEIAIDEGCGEDCWRFNEWIGISEANQWIEGHATVPTTAIGVQFWGDGNDGLARVYLDGTEIWSGDTRGEDNQWPGGAFVRYLEISGLAETNHSLIVEALGEGGQITLYFFGIGAVTP
jgi:pSer/pThr/pTyr-binding forkhead associated (FHA) protein